MSKNKEYSRAWDRVGRAMQTAGEMSDVVVRRNIEVWSTVAENLRTKDRYTAEDWAQDAASGVSALVDNARDIWTVLRALPSSANAVAPLPTVCLFFEPNPEEKPGTADRTYVLTAQPEIPISGRVHSDRPQVYTHLTGDDPDTIDELRRHIWPEYAEDYRLVIVPRGRPKLKPGIYQGLMQVNFNERPAPIALLWIIVS
jgi:hypothetical protein